MGQVDSNTKAILVTGTIIPNSVFVAHTNVEERKQEYIAGMKFYREQFPNDDIYFLENSSFDFESDIDFKNLFETQNIQLLKFPVSTFTQEGKGYQEFYMLDSAMESLAGRYTYFLKITGRYKVLNIASLLHQQNPFIADSHKKPKVTQTNVFYVQSEFYMSHFKGLYKLVNDSKGVFIEHVVYQTLKDKLLISHVAMFRENPKITGFSGSYGGTLNRNKYKMMIRNVERFCLRLFDIPEFLIEY